ncbi:MAG: bifunctional methionine sulfoxide reductase B/A protein [Flavobacteriales bacterium]|nr:bifunctional methionine sulfoxide reductase B/A protein [Flavobacteriales bacterium]
MKKILLILITIIACSLSVVMCAQNKKDTIMKEKMPPLTKAEKSVLEEKATERPFTGKYNDFNEKGTYVCRKCGAELYRSEDKFNSGCGWPAFDDEIKGAVLRKTDPDGMRTEILCAKCGAHLGHVFLGEGLTDKNTRHCVNSVSMVFRPDITIHEKDTLQTVVFASGCFWGTQYWFAKQKGVISSQVGYAGGWVKDPTYEQVCTGQTGHHEAVRVVYNPSEVSFDELLRLYFNTHDVEQTDGQGPDKGAQYLSAIFYTTASQKDEAEKMLERLREKGLKPATRLIPLDIFYPEKQEYHNMYYQKKGSAPYCHFYNEII